MCVRHSSEADRAFFSITPSCATCIRNNQGDYTSTDYNDYTTTTYYDNNDYNDNNNYNQDYNNDYNNNNDYDNNDYDNDNDNDNDYKRRAVPFGKPTPAPNAKRARSIKGKRGILDDLLNLDGLVCTVDGGKSLSSDILLIERAFS